MISTVKSRPTGKKIEIYDDRVKEALDIILPYSKEHNLDEHIDENKVDGWRVQIKEMTVVTNILLFIKSPSDSVKNTMIVLYINTIGELSMNRKLPNKERRFIISSIMLITIERMTYWNTTF